MVVRHDDNTRLQQTSLGVAWGSDADTLFKDPPKDTAGIRVVDSFTNPDFIVWMRTAALPNFAKLYRIITEDMPKGIYRMDIENSTSFSLFFSFFTIVYRCE